MTRPKKALILIENSFVPLDIRVWYEATTLRDAGWQVTIICPSPSGDYAKAVPSISKDEPVDLDGITVFYFSLRSAQRGVAGYLLEYIQAFFAVGRQTWHVWRRERFDVLHICNPPDIFFPYALFYHLKGVGIIYDHHDLFPEFVSHRFPGVTGRLFYKLALFLEYLTYRSSDIIISVNESYHRVALTRGHISPHKGLIVRNGPKASEFGPITPPNDLKKGFPILVCFLGIMGYEDGILELVEAIRHIILDLDRKDIFFYLMGDGAMRTIAIQQVSGWGLEKYVAMPGMVRDRQCIQKYLSAADICVSPEPLSPLNALSTFIKVGEYMAMGKPVIAFDLCETRWTAQQAAVYVQPGDINGFGQAIVELADHPEQRAVKGEIARKRFLEYLCWEGQQENLLKAYQMACDRK